MNSANVLLVDDSLFVHKQIKAHLHGDPLNVVSFYDGESALMNAEDVNPRLILMDIDMPGINGWETCRRLKHLPRVSNAPVIFITADCSTNDKLKAFELGATDYITKPFRPDEVRARVKAALRDRAIISQPSLMDSMTGLWGEPYLNMQLPIQLSLTQRLNAPLACTVAEIDCMQAHYEALGRPAVEQIIQDVAERATAAYRKEDILCHLGSGRLVVLQPGTAHDQAMRIAEELRLRFQEICSSDGNVTCSFGISERQRQWTGSLLEAAEQALFDAKLSGGDAVVPSAESYGKHLLC